jgi:glycosyltransferase involved in cell wall biosynthesis
MSSAQSLSAPVDSEAVAVDTARPVIFVVSQSGSRANGGVESISEILQRLRRVKPIVVTHRETAVTQRWREAGYSVKAWPMDANGVRMISALASNLKMFRLVRTTGCRVVHCNDIAALWHTAFGARLAGAKVVFNVRNIKPATQRYGWRWQWARRLSQRQVVLSREMQTELQRRLGVANDDREGIDYIYSAVDLTRFSPVDDSRRIELRQRLGIPADSFAIGCVAPFDQRKAQLDFIRQAGPLVKNLMPQARIYFIGDFVPAQNDYARRCAEAAESIGLADRISFVGFSTDINNWYRALDVTVIASRNEGLARCMIESLACGTPVVSFEVCSAREILDHLDRGLVVPQDNYPALVRAIGRLAAEDETRRKLGKTSVDAARRLFDPRRAVARYEQLYLALTED